MFFLSFQSTHSRGVRRSVRPLDFLRQSFNPRTHEECDHIYSVNRLCQILFQSTHSRGVRRGTPTSYPTLPVSIHALTRSATSNFNYAERCRIVSIHALTRSATARPSFGTGFCLFQSTHSRGVRPGSFPASECQ